MINLNKKDVKCIFTYKAEYFLNFHLSYDALTSYFIFIYKTSLSSNITKRIDFLEEWWLDTKLR